MRSNVSTIPVDGKDVFLWVPTGFGKSICYETAICFSYKHSDGGTGGGCSVVLVVSPFMSLIMEQSPRKHSCPTASRISIVWLFLRITTTSLMPCPCMPPGDKRSGEQSRISWAYYPKRVMTNENARLVIITWNFPYNSKFVHCHSSIRTFFERVGRKMF